MKVLRIYHAAADPSQRERERRLSALGLDVTLAAPNGWVGTDQGWSGDEAEASFRAVGLAVARRGDVNRHRYVDGVALARLIAQVAPDLLDIHEEPFSHAAQQWIAAAPKNLPVVTYTAQNIDKRYPPPFSFYEQRVHARAAGLYPCSRQAASVARGKGFSGLLDVIPLGFDPQLFRMGEQSLDADELVLALSGRLVPEKGVGDAVRVLARVNLERPARLVVIGSGPEERRAQELADALGVREQFEIESWRRADEVAAVLRRAHIVLVPSVSTPTWAEQFGRVIVEAQACGAVVAGYASGAIPEVAGASALLAPEHDVADLAQRVIDLIADPREFTRRREQGVRLSATRTWDAVAEQHSALYRRVVEGDVKPLRPPRSPRKRRALARAEFGEPAWTPVGRRPFALPLLRRGGVVSSILAGVVDVGAEVAASLRSHPKDDQKFVS